MALCLVPVAVIVWVFVSRTPENPPETLADATRSLPAQSAALRPLPDSAGKPPTVPPSLPPLTTTASNDAEELPEEWEDPLFEILMDEAQSMDARNSRLIEMATRTAVAVPAVQRECLRHLAFGLPDGDRETFLALITNSSIPETLRAEFFGEVLNMRPSFLNGWLSEQVQDHTEWRIRNLACEYLRDLQAEN